MERTLTIDEAKRLIANAYFAGAHDACGSLMSMPDGFRTKGHAFADEQIKRWFDEEIRPSDGLFWQWD